MERVRKDQGKGKGCSCWVSLVQTADARAISEDGTKISRRRWEGGTPMFCTSTCFTMSSVVADWEVHRGFGEKPDMQFKPLISASDFGGAYDSFDLVSGSTSMF